MSQSLKRTVGIATLVSGITAFSGAVNANGDPELSHFTPTPTPVISANNNTQLTVDPKTITPPLR